LDVWKYHDIRHRRHLLCNPIGTQKFERLCSLLNLKRGSRVFDMGCGKGEFLVRLAELYGVSGIGVDISPYCIRDAREKHKNRVPQSDLEFLEADGAKFKAEPESFDVAMCIGACWIYGGYRGTVRAMMEMAKQGGLVLVGEPFWLKEPDEEYLKTVGAETRARDFGSYEDYVRIGEEQGLTCVYSLVSDRDDWDHYEWLTWWALDDYARACPKDPDVSEFVQRGRREKENYLRWQRETLGWALYVFRKPASIVRQT